VRQIRHAVALTRRLYPLLPGRLRYVGHLESGSIVASTRRPDLSIGRVHPASFYAASMCDRPQARHSKV